MNKRDDQSRDKFFQRGHSRGKSLNAINLNHLTNNHRESSRQKDIPGYTKINPLTIKSSKMTPDESFRLRAKNSNDKRSDIILSRSNSDFANINSKSPNQIIIQLNPEKKNIYNNNNNNSNLYNSVSYASQNGNYTGYGNLYRDNSNNNLFHNQKRNLAQNLNKENLIINNNGKLNASVLNTRIHRSPIDPRKSSKISPIRASFNNLEKPSRENRERDTYRNSYNSGTANGFNSSYNFEITKNKFYNNKSNSGSNLNGISNGNVNSNGQSFIVVNSISKSANLEANGLNEGNQARSYLPNVSNKNGNGKDKGLYNGNQHYILSDKKENDHYLNNLNNNSINNNPNLTHYAKGFHTNNNQNSIEGGNSVMQTFTHNQFYSHQHQFNNQPRTKKSSKSFLNSIQNTNNHNEQMLKANSFINSSNANQTNNGKDHERFADNLNINGNNGLNVKKTENANSTMQSKTNNNFLMQNSLKRRTESYTKIELQENVLKNSLNNINNNININNANITRDYGSNINNNDKRENRDYTPSSLQKNNINLTNKKSTATHERNKSLDNSRKGLSFVESQNANFYGGNNNLNNVHDTNFPREPRGLKPLISKIFSAKSKAGRQYDGTTKTNQDSFLIKSKILGLENYGIYGVFDGHGSHGHFVSNMIKLFFSEFFSKPELYLTPQLNNNTRSSVNGINLGTKNYYGNILNKTNFPNAYNLNSNNNIFNNAASAANVNLANLNTELIYEKIKERNYAMLKNSFSLAESSIAVSKYEVNFSGSTCIMLFMLDNRFICANAGDSRAILVSSKSSNSDVITPLSRDHKPELKDEMYRITKLNGRVDRFNDNGIKSGPFRVWLKNQNYPGLAMSRSIGDLVAGSVGVICEPEIFECEINEKAKFVVIASDGIWEFLSNEKVADIINPYYYAGFDVNGAAEKLIEEATRCWRREDETVDDITAVVIFFNA